MKTEEFSHYIDSHCHPCEMDGSNFDFQDLNKNKILELLMAGISPEDWKRQVHFANQWKEEFKSHCSFGLHPYHIHNSSEKDLAKDFELLNTMTQQCLCIGETGLDLRKDFKASSSLQEEYFNKHIELAHSTNKSLILHLVRCHDQSLNILKAQGLKVNAMYHAFNSSPEITREYLKLPIYFSIGGAITYDKNTKLIESLKLIPVDRILIESDSPDQAPYQWHDSQNTPLSIFKVAEKIAEHKKIALDNLWQQVNLNFNTFIGNH